MLFSAVFLGDILAVSGQYTPEKRSLFGGQPELGIFVFTQGLRGEWIFPKGIDRCPSGKSKINLLLLTCDQLWVRRLSQNS